MRLQAMLSHPAVKGLARQPELPRGVTDVKSVPFQSRGYQGTLRCLQMRWSGASEARRCRLQYEISPVLFVSLGEDYRPLHGLRQRANAAWPRCSQDRSSRRGRERQMRATMPALKPPQEILTQEQGVAFSRG